MMTKVTVVKSLFLFVKPPVNILSVGISPDLPLLKQGLVTVETMEINSREKDISITRIF